MSVLGGLIVAPWVCSLSSPTGGSAVPQRVALDVSNPAHCGRETQAAPTTVRPIQVPPAGCWRQHHQRDLGETLLPNDEDRAKRGRRSLPRCEVVDRNRAPLKDWELS